MSNNKDLVAYAKVALAEKWGYVWGTFGQKLTEEVFQQKLKQYPDGVGNYQDFIRKNWLGKKATDCVGLIKGYYWTKDGKIQYVDRTDVTANTMYTMAKERGPIATIPDIPGICVWKSGHIGVYIGGGQVIEAHGTKAGVIQTPLKGGTTWTNWLKCPYIDYIVDPTATKPAAPSPVAKNHLAEIQILCNQLGLTDHEGKALDPDGKIGPRSRAAMAKLPIVQVGSRGPAVTYIQKRLGSTPDGAFGKLTKAVVIAFQERNSFEDVDGIVGSKTWEKLAEI